jgi:hypothetical protein
MCPFIATGFFPRTETMLCLKYARTDAIPCLARKNLNPAFTAYCESSRLYLWRFAAKELTTLRTYPRAL